MKSVASLLAGTAFAVTLLLGGVVVASAVLVPQEDAPRFTGLDVKDLWTLTPQRVDPEKQAYERLPPRYGSQVVMASASPAPQNRLVQDVAPSTATIDIIETAAVTESEGGMDQELPALSEAHVTWCQARYNSYSAQDNSYISYQGDMRTCVSPHLTAPNQDSEDGTEAMLVQDVADRTTPVAIGSAHAQNCLQRYRSYRAEDNSYQPYGGGPRKQCELRSF
ncbi:MAG: BA14K family protein [Rhizobium sp.]|nr:BA14K family protein [Rhizobium sp.]